MQNNMAVFKNFYIFRFDEDSRWALNKDVSVLARTETTDLSRYFWKFKPKLAKTSITIKEMFKLICDNIKLHFKIT